MSIAPAEHRPFAALAYATVEVLPLSRHVGARVIGVDLTRPLPEAVFRDILNAFHRHGILLFRGQSLGNEDLVRFSARFGRLETYSLRPEIQVRGCPELVNIANIADEHGKPIGLAESGRLWHSDLQFKAEPAIASALYCVECTAGDTEFSRMTAAYDALPEATRQRIDGLKAIHSYLAYNAKYNNATRSMNDPQKKLVPDVAHPIARIHLATGRKALYVSEGMTVGIEGLGDDEARALLEELFAHSTQAQFTYRHVYQVGDLILWDNRATMHRAMPFDARHRRHMKRSTIMAQYPDV